MFVFDTETSTDHTQRLKFGSYRFIVDARTLKEGLFHADDLSQNERRALEQYVEFNQADVVSEGLSQLLLLNRADIVKEIGVRPVIEGALTIVCEMDPDAQRNAAEISPLVEGAQTGENGEPAPLPITPGVTADEDKPTPTPKKQ